MKIDLGSGEIYREGFIRVDNNLKCHPDLLLDMQEYVKMLNIDSVDEVIISHSLEFLDGYEIYELMNHLHRAVKKEGIVKIMVTSVVNLDGTINPKAWTVPLQKTHFSEETFKVFNDENTEKYRDLKQWEYTIYNRDGVLEVHLWPKK